MEMQDLKIRDLTMTTANTIFVGAAQFCVPIAGKILVLGMTASAQQLSAMHRRYEEKNRRWLVADWMADVRRRCCH